MTLLHIHREILELAADALDGPTMPPPPEIEQPVSALIEGGLLLVSKGKVAITPDGRAALQS